MPARSHQKKTDWLRSKLFFGLWFGPPESSAALGSGFFVTGSSQLSTDVFYVAEERHEVRVPATMDSLQTIPWAKPLLVEGARRDTD